jgi:hypothetical protein
MNELSETRKEKLVEELSTQYSLGKISLEEYERLIDYSNKIETDRELIIFEKIIQENSAPESYNDDTEYAHNPKTGKDDITVLSSRRTPGSVASSITGRIITILGDHHLCFDEGDLRKNETVLDILVVLGEIVVHVPEDVTVIVNAIPIISGVFGNMRKRKGARGSGKKLIINGHIVMGNVTVKVDE